MGIVRRQSAYSSVFTYIGFAVGAVNVILLFPRFFDTASYGLTRILIDFALFFSAVTTLGSINGLYKFNPFYKSYLPGNKNDLPYLTIVANVIGCTVFVIASLVFQPYLERKFGHNSPLFVAHYKLVIPYTISYTCILVLEAFCWVIKKTIIVNMVKELFYRVTTTVLICLYAFKLVSLDTFFLLFSLSYIPSILVLVYVVFRNGGIVICRTISTATKRLYKRILLFVSFHFSGMLIGILPRTIDGILIAGLSDNGLENLAVYSIPVYLISIMEVPQRSMMGIATTLIAEAWKNKDIAVIRELYQKTSLNLLVIGLGIFGLILPNLDNLVRVVGQEYYLAKTIFVIAGIAKLVDLGMGMNMQILGLSKYWRFDFYTSVFFIVINIVLDYFLIKRYGITGAAYGSGIALIAYNFMRFFYLWYLFKMQPFSAKTAGALCIAAVGIFIAYLLPYMFNPYIDSLVRGALFAFIFASSVLYFKISEDIAALFYGTVNKIYRKK